MNSTPFKLHWHEKWGHWHCHNTVQWRRFVLLVSFLTPWDFHHCESDVTCALKENSDNKYHCRQKFRRTAQTENSSWVLRSEKENKRTRKRVERIESWLKSCKWNANVMLMSSGRWGGCQVGGKVWLESELVKQQANGQRLGEQWAGYPWCLDKRRTIKRPKDGEMERERDLEERPCGLMNAD